MLTQTTMQLTVTHGVVTPHDDVAMPHDDVAMTSHATVTMTQDTERSVVALVLA